MKLYALCDADTLSKKGKSLEDFVSYATKHHAEIIQYRNKTAPLSIIKKDLLKLRQLWDGYLIINDHRELVVFCDGLHMGQDDLRKIAPGIEEAVSLMRSEIGSDKIFGISTHNEAEILEANRLDLNYIGLGAYRDTDTKADTQVLGATLDDLASRSTHPVGAIGGVKLDDRFEHVTYLVIGSALYEN